MAHVSTEEYWDVEGDGDALAVRNWTRAFKVVFDTIEHPDVILNAPGVPRRWESHPSDAAMLAQKGKASHLQGDPFVWMVTIEYSSRTGSEDRGADNPLDRPTEIDTDFINFQRPMVYDRHGKAVLNSANDPPDPFPQIEAARFVIRFGRFEATRDTARSLQYQNAINTDAFFGFAPGEVMCMYIKQRRHFENDQECWFTMYEMQMKGNGFVLSRGVNTPYRGWDAVIPDVGFNELVGGVKKLITTDDRKAVSVPVRLDGFGGKMFPLNPREDTNFLIFEPPYNYQSFAALALP